MTRLPYRVMSSTGRHRSLGLVVLQMDETSEQDMRRLFPAEVPIHVSRVASGADLTPETIGEMEGALPQAARLLPPVSYGAVGYACTSGAALIGPTQVARVLTDVTGTQASTDPLTAAFAALGALGARSVAIVSPYVESVIGPIVQAFEAAGIDVSASLSFGEQVESRVARIDAESIRSAARSAALSGADAVFLSCTNLRTLDLIDDLESEIGRPSLSSNQVLAWHMARLAGVPLSDRAPGKLSRMAV